MNGRRRATGGVIVALAMAFAMLVPAGAATAAPATDPRAAGVRVCDKFGSTPVAGGRYRVQNNVWGADTRQCVTAFDTGFVVDPAEHRKTNEPAAYPAMIFGCHYGLCTTGTPLPRMLSDLGDLRSSWSTAVPPTGEHNVAYDLWMDPTPRRDGRPTGLELMIWLETTDRVQPIGSKKAEVEIGGTRWDVWLGTIDLPTITYVRTAPTLEVTDLPLSDFVRDATNRGVAKPDWYMTSVQAGFEPWIGGSGLTTRSFSVTRNGQ